MPPIVVDPAHGSLGPLGQARPARSGDIVFRMGDARVAHGYFRISRFLAKCSNSSSRIRASLSVEGDEPCRL